MIVRLIGPQCLCSNICLLGIGQLGKMFALARNELAWRDGETRTDVIVMVMIIASHNNYGIEQSPILAVLHPLCNSKLVAVVVVIAIMFSWTQAPFTSRHSRTRPANRVHLRAYYTPWINHEPWDHSLPNKC